MRGPRQARGQGGQYPVGSFNQADLDVLVGVNPVQAESDHLTRGPVQFGRQFHAGRTRADDGHVQLALVDISRLVVGAYAGVHHLGMELLGVVLGLQPQGKFLDTLGPEIIA